VNPLLIANGYLRSGVPSYVPWLDGEPLSTVCDFDKSRLWQAGSERLLQQVLTVSRSSTATYVGSDGLIKSAVSNELRVDHDPVTFAARRVLLERAATNLITRSNSFTDWGTGVALTATAAVAPDGTTTGWLWECNDSGGAEEGGRIGVSQATSTTYTASVWAKYKNCKYVLLRNLGFVGANVNEECCFFDVELGTVALRGAKWSSASVETYANGWMRLIATGTTAASIPNNLFDIRLSSTGTDLTHVNGEGVYLWGAQIEAGATASSYIPTTGSTVTRAADRPSIATSQLAYDPSSGSLIVTGRTAGTAADQVAAQIDDGTENNRFRVYRDGSRRVRFVVTSGGVEQANLDLGTVADNTDFDVAVAWAAGNFAASLDGTTALTDAAGTVPSGLTTMRWRSGVSSADWDGDLDKVAYEPERLDNAALEELSA
jgi:hypothetical protein